MDNFDSITLSFDTSKMQQTKSNVVVIHGLAGFTPEIYQMLSNRTGGIGWRPDGHSADDIEFVLFFDRDTGVGTIKIVGIDTWGPPA